MHKVGELNKAFYCAGALRMRASAVHIFVAPSGQLFRQPGLDSGIVCALMTRVALEKYSLCHFERRKKRDIICP